MPASSPAAVPSFLRATLALLVTLLALGGALVGALLLATGALLTLGLRALGLGARRPAPIAPRARPEAISGIIEGEYRVVEARASRTP